MFKNARISWKSTAMGLLVLVGTGLQIAKGAQATSPMEALMKALNDPQTLAQIAGGVGLIAAKDGDVSGTATQSK